MQEIIINVLCFRCLCVQRTSSTSGEAELMSEFYNLFNFFVVQ